MSSLPSEMTPAILRERARELSAQRRFGEAVTVLWEAAASRPDDAQTLCDLGNALVNDRRPEQGATLLRQAMRLSPGEPRLYSNLGLALAAMGRFDEAEESLLQALDLEPVLPLAHNNLATLYIMMGRHDAALACLDYALRLQRDYPAARRNRALAHLSLGNFEEGWRDYDHVAFGIERPPLPWAEWHGEPLTGKRLLLTAQQGLGDTLQFLRYAPLLGKQAARVVLECPGPLMELLRAGCPGIDEIVPQGQAVEGVDLCVAVAALPRVFNTSLETIPPPVPIAAPADRVEHWRSKLAEKLPKHERIVGIAWQGNPHHQWDQFRSVRLAMFERLAQLFGVRLLSLQSGPGLEQIEPFERLCGKRMIVPQAHAHNLADTAALASLCDLVISVDSASAHLAATMGKPTWILLSVAADWRWLTVREDSPWYPSVRLFRQQRINAWEDLFARVAEKAAEALSAGAQQL
jgi:Flp pilus assembly protein TadD